jgi:hypothetical protein
VEAIFITGCKQQQANLIYESNFLPFVLPFKLATSFISIGVRPIWPTGYGDGSEIDWRIQLVMHQLTMPIAIRP